jgi:hypothetical protein
MAVVAADAELAEARLVSAAILTKTARSVRSSQRESQTFLVVQSSFEVDVSSIQHRPIILIPFTTAIDLLAR